MSKNFATFKRLKGTAELYSAAKELAAPNSSLNLVLAYGGNGNGKTHLGVAIVLESISLGIAARIIRCPEWLDDIKYAYSQGSSELAENIRHKYTSLPVLVFDEVKWRTETDEDWIDSLISARVDNNLKTYLTTNYDYPELSEKFPRLVSRALSKTTGRLVLNKGQDMRPALG